MDNLAQVEPHLMTTRAAVVEEQVQAVQMQVVINREQAAQVPTLIQLGLQQLQQV